MILPLYLRLNNSKSIECEMKGSGFIDLQVNGFGGIDFASPGLALEEILLVTRELVRHGTMKFLPTIISSPHEVYERNLPLFARAMELPEIKDHIPGLHLEGPFISKEPGIRGAHHPAWIIPPDIRLFDRFMELAKEKIKMLTLAADLPGADQLCRHATQRGVTVSLGHQDATTEDLQRLVEAGARSLTHLGNGIPKKISRHDNPLFAGMANDDLTAMIITDGHHLSLPLLKTIIRTKGINRIIVVSDSSPVAGLLPGKYKTYGQIVRLERGGRLYIPRTGYLAGSSATMKQCIEYLGASGLVKEEELETVGIHNPSRLIGLSTGNDS
jgi:N-acetylglucosamine-6-phosphate deacetylase